MSDGETPTGPRFIVGLGNPGRRYERTRHNLGFMLIDKLKQHWGAASEKRSFDALVSEAVGPFGKIVLLKPQTFMNCSGRTVAQAARFYKAQPDDFLIVLDDMALDADKVRIRAKGSAGGHNGLQDIINALGTNQISRLRLGIGMAPSFMDSADYVLAKMDEAACADANTAVDLGVKAVEDWLKFGTVEAMNRNN